ncbi:hypothetical protein JDF658_12240 [Carboxydocella sp. JDF658]|nr:hypothetical protein ULO1_22190 [Carboxydocella sp. ULO1]GAW31459.1 hypothetical protein JDF658_12240 [Carboxydocella sp. JDF658]
MSQWCRICEEPLERPKDRSICDRCESQVDRQARSSWSPLTAEVVRQRLRQKGYQRASKKSNSS